MPALFLALGGAVRLILHTPDSNGELRDIYRHAFTNAVELFIVTAFLTEWDTSLELSAGCRRFRVITGKDFGITKKAACTSLMGWLPPTRKHEFMVADRISGFHPKAVFWKEKSGRTFAIVGSSNLTLAAFETNYEANSYGSLTTTEYARAKSWIKGIEKQAVVVSEDWLGKYNEMPSPHSGGSKPQDEDEPDTIPLVGFKLPKPSGMSKNIAERREQLAVYEKKEKSLTSLFRRCAKREIESSQFYDELPKYWSYEVGDRLQGAGWERKGKNSDFQDLSRSFVAIIDAADEDRDDVVVEEIDRLCKAGVPARGAFLSEMLCLRFPDEYPVLNKPVHQYLIDVKFKAPDGASEGVRYLDLAKKLRFSLLQNQRHPAKNLAELDTVIWLQYHD
jgi:HKD family nuclease